MTDCIVKKCSKCGEVKSIGEFHKYCNSKDGHKRLCKMCRKKEGLVRYRECKARKKIHVDQKLCFKCQTKKDISNFDYSTSSIDNCRNICKSCRSIERSKNRHKKNEYDKTRRKKDCMYKVVCNLRIRLHYAVKNGWKNGSTIKDLGCTVEELKKHLELQFKEGMSWDNYGFYGWHIDHVIPLSSFDLSDRKQFLEACNYKNLQPLWAQENLSKGSKIL